MMFDRRMFGLYCTSNSCLGNLIGQLKLIGSLIFQLNTWSCTRSHLVPHLWYNLLLGIRQPHANTFLLFKNACNKFE